MRQTIAATLVLFSAGVAAAQWLTPFVETGAVGDTQTHEGWVITFDRAPNSDVEFTVLVPSDSRGLVSIIAKAKPGLVKSDLLGRPVTITATIIGTNHGRELELVSLEAIRK